MMRALHPSVEEADPGKLPTCFLFRVREVKTCLGPIAALRGHSEGPQGHSLSLAYMEALAQ